MLFLKLWVGGVGDWSGQGQGQGQVRVGVGDHGSFNRLRSILAVLGFGPE